MLRNLFSSPAARLSRYARSFSATAKLPDLPYGYNELEPAISGKIMELHHLKHHAGYVNNYNAAIQQYTEAEKRGSISDMIGLQQAIKFNGGGHLNHSIFWTNLCPPKKYQDPSGDLLHALERTFGTFKDFQAAFTAQAASVQGSGWAWLVLNKNDGNILIQTLPNQDPVHPNFVPLLGVDVWEHAYYLDYKNVRPDYLRNIWTVINWANVSERFVKAVQERNISLSKTK